MKICTMQRPAFKTYYVVYIYIYVYIANIRAGTDTNGIIFAIFDKQSISNAHIKIIFNACAAAAWFIFALTACRSAGEHKRGRERYEESERVHMCNRQQPHWIAVVIILNSLIV